MGSTSTLAYSLSSNIIKKHGFHPRSHPCSSDVTHLDLPRHEAPGCLGFNDFKAPRQATPLLLHAVDDPRGGHDVDSLAATLQLRPGLVARGQVVRDDVAHVGEAILLIDTAVFHDDPLQLLVRYTDAPSHPEAQALKDARFHASASWNLWNGRSCKGG